MTVVVLKYAHKFFYTFLLERWSLISLALNMG